VPRARGRWHGGSGAGAHCWTLRMDWTWPVCAWEPHSRTCLYSPAWLSLSRRYWKPRYPGYCEQTHLRRSRGRRRLRTKHPAPRAGCRQLPEHPQIRCVPPVPGPGGLRGAPGVLTRRSGRGRSPRRCCPSPGPAARGSRRSAPRACPGSSPARRASACCARGPAAKRGTASVRHGTARHGTARHGMTRPPGWRWAAGAGGGERGHSRRRRRGGRSTSSPRGRRCCRSMPPSTGTRRAPARTAGPGSRSARSLPSCRGGRRGETPAAPTTPLTAGAVPAAPRGAGAVPRRRQPHGSGGKRQPLPSSSPLPAWGPTALWGGSPLWPPLTPRSRSCRSGRC